MTITKLPTCTIGSLGATKVDRTTAINPYKDTVASEVNLSNQCIEELFARLGLLGAAGSYELRLDELMDPKVHFRAEDFDTWSATSSPGWDNGVGIDPWTVNANDLRAGLYAVFDEEVVMSTPQMYLVDHELECRFIVKVDAWDSNVGSCFISALYDVENNYLVAGVRINDNGTGGSPPFNRRIQGVVGDNFGVITETDLGAFEDDTDYEIKWRLERISAGVVKLYVSVNGAEEVGCGTPDTPISPKCYLSFSAPHTGGGAGKFYLYQLRRKANWDPTLESMDMDMVMGS